jgi:hypothetical protein
MSDTAAAYGEITVTRLQEELKVAHMDAANARHAAAQSQLATAAALLECAVLSKQLVEREAMDQSTYEASLPAISNQVLQSERDARHVRRQETTADNKNIANYLQAAREQDLVIANLNAELSETKLQVLQLQEQIQEKNVSIGQAQEFESLVKSLRTQIADLDTEHKIVLSTAHGQIEVLSNRLFEVVATETHTSMVATFQQEIERLRVQAQEFEPLVNSLRTQIATLYTEHKIALSTAHGQINLLSNRLLQVVATETHTSMRTALQQEIDKLQQEVEKCFPLVNSLRAEMDGLNTEHKIALGIAHSQIEVLSNRLLQVVDSETHTTIVSALEEEFEKLRSQAQEYEPLVNSLRTEIDRLQTEHKIALSTAHGQIDVLSNRLLQVVATETHNSVVAAFRLQVEKLRQQVVAITAHADRNLSDSRSIGAQGGALMIEIRNVSNRLRDILSIPSMPPELVQAIQPHNATINIAIRNAARVSFLLETSLKFSKLKVVLLSFNTHNRHCMENFGLEDFASRDQRKRLEEAIVLASEILDAVVITTPDLPPMCLAIRANRQLLHQLRQECAITLNQPARGVDVIHTMYNLGNDVFASLNQHQVLPTATATPTATPTPTAAAAHN